jgi:membrane dipeptidase
LRTNPRRNSRVTASTFALVLLLLAATTAGVVRAGDKPDALLKHARELAQRVIIIDTHIDAPMRLLAGREDVRRQTVNGQFDYVRARKGELTLAFMSIYTPPALEGTGNSGPKADSLIRAVERLAASASEKFALVRSVADVRGGAGKGRVLLALGMENGSPIEGKLENVRRYYDRGVRYITLAHAKSNHLADASFDPVRRWGGLSPFGREVVNEMNRLGIMVDISHLTGSAAFQVLRLSKAPVIASHSSCRFFTPGFERNISDELIRAVAAQGGVVQINFASMFLDEAFRRREEREQKVMEKRLARSGVQLWSREAERALAEYRRSHPLPFPTVKKIADHIDHIVALVGVDHVGFGSDFDGAGDTFPIGMKDVSQYPNLIAELLRRGYREEDIRKICGENLLRVWGAVERVAAQGGSAR